MSSWMCFVFSMSSTAGTISAVITIIPRWNGFARYLLGRVPASGSTGSVAENGKVQLSLHYDYALRALVYLGTHPNKVIATQEISTAYGISKHHLVRVVQTLAEHNYVDLRTGRSGGIKLSMEPHLIHLGDVIRDR